MEWLKSVKNVVFSDKDVNLPDDKTCSSFWNKGPQLKKRKKKLTFAEK